jgi:hypothetical protein
LQNKKESQNLKLEPIQDAKFVADRIQYIEILGYVVFALEKWQTRD